MRKLSLIALAALIVAALPLSLVAAPARLITKPPVTSGPYPFTGPAVDPTADKGQWFLDIRTGVAIEEVRPYEFYDNIIPEGGGFASTDAITGYAFGAVLGGGGVAGVDPIVAFKIRATVTNDLPGVFPLEFGAPGANSHDEFLFIPVPPLAPKYAGTMYDVKLTAEFALPAAGVPVPIPVGLDPYFAPTRPINALNHDQLGWYCWSPAGPLPTAFPSGGYMVPTWDFGDIALGASAVRIMDFTAAIGPADPLYGIILGGAGGNLIDLFLNRTTDLKIGDFVDNLSIDDGTAYPMPTFLPPARRSGDVSVFFNPVPEPSTYALGMAAAGMAAFWYRRRRTA